LKQAALGHIISERTNTAWNAQGAATAWGDKWFHFDLLGNTTGEIGPDGSVTTQVDMEAFGTVLSGGQNGYRLTTKQYDPDAGLYYFNARWYLPSPSRWLEEEPSAMDGPNLYMFVQGNPIIYCDLDGLVSVDALVARNHVITPKIGPSPSSGLHCFFDVDGDEVSFNGKRVVRINRHRMGWGIGGAYKDCDSNCLMRYINGSMRGLGPDDYDKRNYNCCHWVTEGMRNCCRYEPLDRYTDMRRRGL
jgi:RHS repeat-associated protein